MLPRSTSSEPGRWRTDRAPYQRGIMDAISDLTVQRVAVVSSAQVGKSAMLLLTVGYYADQDPAPILLVQPSLEFARDFSRDRVKPFILATPVLRAKVKEAGGRRDSSDTLLRKEFPGGYLTLVGANSATGLASRPIRVVLFDEVDKFPPSAGDKGDPVSLAITRTRTFWNRKIVMMTTPGVKGASRIEKEWAESDQRRYYVPCPHCGHEQHLRWEHIDFETASYMCESCATLISELQKPAMLARGRWIATRPDGAFPGFHLNALYSPWTTWKELIAKFLVAKKSPDTLQVFVNEDLGELWDPQDGEGVDTTSLTTRRESYLAEVPAGVAVLTAGIDVHHDRLELAIKGWGAGQESWLIAHHRIYGDPARRETWDRAEQLLLKPYQHEYGARLTVRATCIDSGDGQTVQYVYGFVRPRQRRGVYATKGLSIPAKPIINRPSRANKYGVKVVPIGTDTAKDVVFQRLKLALPETGVAPHGFMHFPKPQLDGCDDEYLEQFGREKVFTRYLKGVPVRRYEVVPAGARNEAIDLEVLNLAALHMLGAGVYDQLGAWVAKVHAEGARVGGVAGQQPSSVTPVAEPPTSLIESGVSFQPTAIAPVPKLQPQRTPMAPRRPGGYVNGWKR